MAEKVKIVNDSMVCLAMHELLKKGYRILIYWLNLVFENYTLSLKNPWIVLEICLSKVLWT